MNFNSDHKRFIETLQKINFSVLFILKMNTIGNLTEKSLGGGLFCFYVASNLNECHVLQHDQR